MVVGLPLTAASVKVVPESGSLSFASKLPVRFDAAASSDIELVFFQPRS